MNSVQLFLTALFKKVATIYTYGTALRQRRTCSTFSSVSQIRVEWVLSRLTYLH